MKRLTSTLFITSVLFAVISLSGCNKKCDLGEDITSGEIKAGVSVFPESGYMTNGMGGHYLIRGSHPYANRFKISHDMGVTKSDVNYNEYSILCYPMTVNCFAQFDKSVVIDDVNEIVKFTVRVKDCGQCEQQRFVENYVVIRSIPETYMVIYDVDVQTVN